MSDSTPGQDSVDVIIIGAGLGGLCVAIGLQKKYPHASFAVYERNRRVGGTWAKNTYPGLRCDIPSQLYSYSFAPNPNWSSTYASQSEILAYIDDVVDDHRLRESIYLQQECISAYWEEDDCFWRVSFLDHTTDTEHTVRCRILISSTGFLDIPRGPEDIANFQLFKGKVFHSSSWDHETEFDGKNVVVVGNGCSANQFIPYLLKESHVAGVVQIIRSAHWVAPKEDKQIGPVKKWFWRHFPLIAKFQRWWLAAKFDSTFPIFKRAMIGRFLRNQVERSIRDYIERTAPPKYHPLLIPDFPFGAKRPVLDHGYLDALNDPRLALVRSKTVQVLDSYMLATETEERIPADILILANGFKTQSLLTPMKIVGKMGAVLPDIWHQEGNYPSAYMGTMVHSFPNFFIVTGPNTLPSGHSTLLGIECTADYILRVIRPLISSMSASRCKKLEVRRESQDRFNSGIQLKLDRLIYSSSVHNWYVDARTGRNTLIWPGSQFHFWLSRSVWPVQWGDFEMSY